MSGAHPQADRAGGLRPEPASQSQPKALIPCAGFGKCSVHALASVIAAFRRELPGWWFTVGECSVSADASCGPDRTGPDRALLANRVFDEGFHADLPQPATMAEALATVTAQAIEARRAATGTGAVHESAVPQGMRPEDGQ